MRNNLLLVPVKFLSVPCQKLKGTLGKPFTYKELNIRMNIKELIKRIKLNAFYQMQTAIGCQIEFRLKLVIKNVVSLITFGFIGRIDHLSISKVFKNVLSLYFDNYTNMMNQLSLKDFQIPLNFKVANEV
jgi:hypothetical protein